MRRLGVLLGTVVVAATCALAPSAASAYSSGTFTKAVATEDWSHGSFSAQVNAAPCGAGFCSYFAVVMAQPSLPEYSCRAEEFFDSDRNTQEIWSGPKQGANGTFEAAATNVSILHGVYGQRYCLELVGEREEPNVVCEAQGKVLEELGLGPVSCPPKKVIFGEVVASAVATVEVPPPPVAVPIAPVAPVTPSASCVRGAEAVAKAWSRVAKARKVLQGAKHSHRPTRIKRQAWERDKKEARQTEQQQHELCG